MAVGVTPARADELSERRTQVKEHESTEAIGKPRPGKRAHAEAQIIVRSSQAKPYDESARPALVRIRLSETFSGDIDGESEVEALQVRWDGKSASMISVQRFRG